MFTGIVQHVGVLRRIERNARGARLSVEAPYEKLADGESVSVAGVCLTVVKVASHGFEADASLETIERSTLGHATSGSRVNLERAMALGDRVGGHLVTGHVDGMGKLLDRRALGDALELRVSMPPALAPLVAPKGSIAIDGVSLTVNAATRAWLEVVVVPFSRRATTLDALAVSDDVNLEVDLLAKYVSRALGRPGVDGVTVDVQDTGGVTLDLLRRSGYV